MKPTLLEIALCAALVLLAALASAAPHPAVARVVVQERGATSYGSGTLIDRREQHGLVVTNWHVVRDAAGKIEVLFPDGFRSQARAIKLDEDWDLAALVIWRPPVEPVPIAARPPRPGEPLTICGYGQGEYRQATGRCTDFYAPEVGLPHELVELSVEARQGDSGGPILNSRGELAGVLFGAGQGTTLGSFAPRVETFLATLAPDIGQPGIGQPASGAGLPETPPLFAHAPPLKASTTEGESPPQWSCLDGPKELTTCGACDTRSCASPSATQSASTTPPKRDAYAPWDKTAKRNATQQESASQPEQPPTTAVALEQATTPQVLPLGGPLWFRAVRDLLAVVGLAFLFLQLVKAAA